MLGRDGISVNDDPNKSTNPKGHKGAEHEDTGKHGISAKIKGALHKG